MNITPLHTLYESFTCNTKVIRNAKWHTYNSHNLPNETVGHPKHCRAILVKHYVCVCVFCEQSIQKVPLPLLYSAVLMPFSVNYTMHSIEEAKQSKFANV